MIAIDTNILLYAHRVDAEWHEAAYRAVAGAAESRQAWAIPWPCIHEFIAIATHRRIYAPPTPLPAALDQVDAWFESPTLVLLAESPGYWPVLREQLEAGRVAGPEIHDARIAALCMEHGVSEIWTADRDFNRFSGLKLRNPLVD
jgi:toxin-antitoxin system PIN domain toxin